MSRSLEVTSDKRAQKEMEQGFAAVQTSLNQVKISISKFENLIEECRIMEEEVHKESQGPSNSGEEADDDIVMADQEESGCLESSGPSSGWSEGPHIEANTEDNPPSASGGNIISPEEEEILMGGSPQSEDHSPRNETASVLGGMSELHLSSPACPGPEEGEIS